MLRAFTLIETLVVVSILAILAALLVPSLQSAREAERNVRCLTQLREWSLAVAYYAQEFNGYLPRRGQGVNPTVQIARREDWFNALPSYLNERSFAQRVADGDRPQPGDKSVWVCPSAKDPGNPYFFAYAMNMMLSTWLEPKPDCMDDVRGTNTMVFLADGPGGHCSTVPTYLQFGPSARHRGNVNLAFLDGHVQSLGGDYVGCGRGDPRRPDVRWLVPNRPWPEPGQPELP